MSRAIEWKLRDFDPMVASALNKALAAIDARFTSVFGGILAARGVTTETLEEFLSPDLSRLVAPASLPGVTNAVEILLVAIRERKHVVVFGDYDADGVCASAILVTTIRKLGGVADVILPNRVGEGYGLTDASVERMLNTYPDVALVVTVDNGITAVDQIAKLRERNIGVIVTDHHLPGDVLPECEALVDPKVASAPGCDGLCGAGVAFFLSNALTQKAKDEGLYAGGKFGAPLMVLAGVATVVDVMVLSGQNRILVSAALKCFKYAPIGLRELFIADGSRSLESVSAGDFGFFVGPRLNASGRMETPMSAYELVSTEDREEARQLAVKVKGLNASRRGYEDRMTDAAMSQIVQGAAAQVTCGRMLAPNSKDPDAWHPGVGGIVASRVMEQVQVPTAVAVVSEDGVWHGSVRAPEGYNVRDALAECADCLLTFGGHAAAAGFAVKPGEGDRFRELFAAACAKQSEGAATAVKRYDGELAPSDITIELCEAIAKLAPFGTGNPEPLFLLRGVLLSDAKVMGADGKHLSVSFQTPGVPRAVWWRHGDMAEGLRRGSADRYDLMFTIVASDFGSMGPHPELVIEDMRKSEVG